MEGIKVVRIGLGEVTSNWGTFDGLPALFLEPISPAGKVGELAPGEQKNSVVPGSVILQFHGTGGGEVVISDIQSCIALNGFIPESNRPLAGAAPAHCR